MKRILLAVLLYLSSMPLVDGGHNIHPHFMKWLEANLKKEEVNAFVRNDLITGSFGGGGPPTKKTKDRPVVFVHGLSNEAGNFWKIARDFAAAGFPTNYMFATTWGKGAESINLHVAMDCTFVKHIRRWIELVLKYTGAQQIDVIGYSMGSPIARKAILGGKCVDDATVDLGPSLTSKVHTYISVAGANQGSRLCRASIFKICNKLTGLICDSEFLTDINRLSGYESSNRTFSLASTGDYLVGYKACGKRASEFAGATDWTLEWMDHEETEFDTADVQLKMLRGEVDKQPPASTSPSTLKPSGDSSSFSGLTFSFSNTNSVASPETATAISVDRVSSSTSSPEVTTPPANSSVPVRVSVISPDFKDYIAYCMIIILCSGFICFKLLLPDSQKSSECFEDVAEKNHEVKDESEVRKPHHLIIVIN